MHRQNNAQSWNHQGSKLVLVTCHWKDNCGYILIQLWRSRCFMLIGKSCCRGARIVGAENPQRLESEPNISFASRKMSISGCICVALVEMSSLLWLGKHLFYCIWHCPNYQVNKCQQCPDVMRI